MDNTSKICLFVTGGTFDKEYNELNGSLYFKNTHTTEMLKLGRSNLDIEIETLMMIDSLDMQDEHREIIKNKIISCKSDKIVITHGTDTMEITAKLLGQLQLAKTVVFTGAMIPYKFGSSDGMFNLGSALAFCQSLPHGVYVAMNGKFFAWNKVTKDKKLGIFVEI